MLSTWLLGPQLVGFVFILTGAMQIIFPPKKINSFYGYRTSSSKSNQARWDAAQRYSGRLMLKLGAIYTIVGLCIAAMLSHQQAAHSNIPSIVTIFAGMSAPVLVIALTERHLNRML